MSPGIEAAEVDLKMRTTKSKANPGLAQLICFKDMICMSEKLLLNAEFLLIYCRDLANAVIFIRSSEAGVSAVFRHLRLNQEMEFCIPVISTLNNMNPGITSLLNDT